MMNRLFRYLLIVLGECLLLFALCLLFEDRNSQFWLYAIVLSSAYLANTFGYPALSRQQTENQTAGYGLTWLSTWIYTAAVVLATVLFYVVEVEIHWQILLFAVLFLAYLIGVYWGRIAAEHAGHIEAENQRERKNITRLQEKAQMLQALLPSHVEDDLKKELLEVAERVSYLIPTDKASALALETDIADVLDRLVDSLSEHRPSADWLPLVTRCRQLLKQRMALN